MKVQSIVDKLLRSKEPAIRWKVRVQLLGENPASKAMCDLQQEIRTCPRVQTLLSKRDGQGRLIHSENIYAKWQGAHWIMATLADIGYPPGDPALLPVRDQLMNWWLADEFYQEFEVENKARSYGKRGVPLMQGRYRRCASQQGNALFSIMKLGLADSRTQELVERLLHWQWPDGGWNCDRNPEARHSSFMESLIPLRALALFAKEGNYKEAAQAARRAAELFLKRQLFRRQSDGTTIHPEFLRLHYPLYWHYDILAGLKVMSETGFINDPRCQDALDLLVTKRLPDGGWPAESKYYKASAKIQLGAELVDWGGTSRKKMNEWVTADALFVLKTAGRLDLS